MSEEKIENDNKTVEYKPALVKILNVVAVVLFLILILVIYLPANIWKEEEYIRNMSRKRMSILYDVEQFYGQMAGKFQTDPLFAMKLLTAVRDSTRADSNFFGEQKIKLSDGFFEMDVIKNFYQIFDTTFALEYQMRDTIIDTSYGVIIWNEDIFAYDTIFVHSSRIDAVKNDSLFRECLDAEISSRVSTNTYFKPYYLDTNFAYSPLINEQYQIHIDGSNIRIQDPLKGEYREPRYLVFAFKDTSHGWIENGERSWERR